MSKPHTPDVLNEKVVHITKSYEKFKTMDGNRHVNDTHVKQLQRLMLTNGNLTAEFPIIVDKDHYVIDGQHRLEALKGLGWEIGYRIEENATIDTVRAINQGNRNWGWRDMAYSYAQRGNENYQWFLAFVDQYGLKFHPGVRLATVVGGTSATSASKGFAGGDLVIADKAKAHDQARQLIEIQRLVQLDGGDFSNALITVMRSPAYDHERMMHKLRQQGELLPGKAKITDYMRRLEDMYNFGFAEDARVRLF
ncbi:hypothetical protein B5P43_18325 [Bacillus sp. SRB_336]|nr:hypothetical protein B5P43_18325 [Bacillus sp. SRB_336]